MKHRRGSRMAAGLLALLTAFCLAGCGAKEDPVQRGMELLGTLDYQEALAVFDTAEAEGGNIRLIERGRGIAYLGLARYDQAIECLRAALAASDGLIEPVDFDLNYYLAAAYAKNRQYEEAEAVYDAILALRPEEKDAYLLRGNARLARDEYNLAKEDFDKVLSLEPKNYDRLIRIYEMLEAYGYREVGAEYLQNSLASYESQMQAYDRGRMYYYLRDYQKAYLALEEAKEKGGVESFLYLGRAYEATGDYNYAASVYNQCLARGLEDARIYNQLGLCSLAMQNYSQALEAFQAGRRLENNGIGQTLAFNEVVAYEYLGEFRTARSLLEQYMKTYPDDAVGRRELDFLSTR